MTYIPFIAFGRILHDFMNCMRVANYESDSGKLMKIFYL